MFRARDRTGTGLSRRRFLRLSGFAAFALGSGSLLSGCVDQHPRDKDGDGQPDDVAIVATSPAVADVCDKLELDLVGVPQTSKTLPDRYKDLPTVGTPMSPDLEVLAQMRPDYVLSPSTLLSDLQPKYAAAHLACIFLDMTSVQGMYDSAAYLGRKFDKVDQANALVDEYNAYIDGYRASHEGETAPTVLLLMGLPGSYLVATEHSYAGSLVELAGGRNVYAGESDQEFLNIGTEDMQARDPDVILRTAHAMPDQVAQMFADEFATNDIWKHFRAVQEDRVWDLPSEAFGMSATFDYPDALAFLEPIFYGGATGSDGASVSDEGSGGADDSGDASASDDSAASSASGESTQG